MGPSGYAWRPLTKLMAGRVKAPRLGFFSSSLAPDQKIRPNRSRPLHIGNQEAGHPICRCERMRRPRVRIFLRFFLNFAGSLSSCGLKTSGGVPTLLGALGFMPVFIFFYSYFIWVPRESNDEKASWVAASPLFPWEVNEKPTIMPSAWGSHACFSAVLENVKSGKCPKSPLPAKRFFFFFGG